MASTEPPKPAGQDASPDVPQSRKRFVPLGIFYSLRRKQTVASTEVEADMESRKQPRGYELARPQIRPL